MQLRSSRPEPTNDWLHEWFWRNWQAWWRKNWWLLPAHIGFVTLLTYLSQLAYDHGIIPRFRWPPLAWLDELSGYAAAAGYMWIPALISTSLVRKLCPPLSLVPSAEPRTLWRYVFSVTRLACCMGFVVTYLPSTLAMSLVM